MALNCGLPGAGVAICARGLEALKATAQEIKDATGSQVISIRADMTSPEDIKLLVFSTVQALGEIDILVNNAVNSTSGRASELPDGDIGYGSLHDFRGGNALPGCSLFNQPHLPLGSRAAGMYAVDQNPIGGDVVGQ